MNILVLAPELPYPPIGGGKLRVYNLLRRLAERHRLEMVCFLHDPSEEEHLPAVRGWMDVTAVPWTQPPLYAAMDAGADPEALGRESALPFLAAYFDSAAYRDAVSSKLANGRYDAVYVVTSMMGQHLRDGMPPAVVDLWNLETLVQQRAWERSADPSDHVQWERMEAYERDVFARCAAVLPVSEKEAEGVRRLFGHGGVVTIDNGVDTRVFQPSPVPAGRDLVFTGTLKYEPNAEGILWFLREIWPAVREEEPQARLWVVGQSPPDAVMAYHGGPVTVTGFVPEVQPYLARARVCVVPLLSGGGTRLKILEALAAGRPVVSTPLGAEGIAVTGGRDILLAESPDAFARATVEVLRSDGLASGLGRAGRRLVEQRYDWDALAARLEEVLVALGPSG